MKTIIHIGLPRTGTTFISRMLENYNFNNEILFNPHIIIKNLKLLIRESLDDKEVETAKEEILSFIKHKTNKDILIIFEDIAEPFSYVPYDRNRMQSCFSNIDTRLSLIKELFHDPYIIISLRYQLDWLESIYRLYFEHGPQNLSFNDFINYKKDHISDTDNIKHTNISISNINYTDLIGSLNNKFSTNKILITFFEHLKCDPISYLESYFKFIDLKIPPDLDLTPVGSSMSNASIFISRVIGTFTSNDNLTCPNYYPFHTLLPNNKHKFIDSFPALSNFYDKLYNITYKGIFHKTTDTIFKSNNKSLVENNTRVFLEKYYRDSNISLNKMIGNKLPLNYLT
jgi:hypothetical protein